MENNRKRCLTRIIIAQFTNEICAWVWYNPRAIDLMIINTKTTISVIIKIQTLMNEVIIYSLNKDSWIELRNVYVLRNELHCNLSAVKHKSQLAPQILFVSFIILFCMWYLWLKMANIITQIQQKDEKLLSLLVIYAIYT